MKQEKTISLRSLVVGTLFAITFAIVTVYFSNRKGMIVTATQIAVLPYMLLILMVLLLNPLCRLIRVVRRFSVGEIMIIFIMGTVSAGLSTFGLTEQLVPIAGSLFNVEWNTSQAEWNRYVVPFVNEKYFVSEPGIQLAADRYRRALETSLNTKSVYDLALTYKRAQIKLAAAEAILKQKQAEADAVPDDQEKTARISAARHAVANARDVHNQITSQWAAWTARGPPGVVDDVLKTHPRKIEAEEQQFQQEKQALAELENIAFEKVRIFRRGLPRGLRAYPGIIPMADDDFHSYGRRLKRAACGRSALNELKQARAMLDDRPESATISHADAETIDRHLASAVRALQPVAKTENYEQIRKVLSDKEDVAVGHLAELDQRLKQLSGERRKVDRSEVSQVDRQLATVAAEREQWQDIQRVAASARERSTRQLAMARKVAEVMARIEAMRIALRQKITVSEIQAGLNDLTRAFPYIEGSWRQYFVGDVPWSHWMRPVVRWGFVIVLTYIILMSLNLLIFRQWAYNEKLTYPLAELPKALVAEDGIPPVFRSPLFWMGALLSGSVLGWNVFCRTNIVPGLVPLNFNNSWYPYVVNTTFDGLKNSSCPVFFTIIGLSFLVPKNISFSLWFFYVIGLVELQLMVWTGHGVDSRSFKSDFWYLMHYGTAQGQGALLVFSTVVLYKCRKYILCAFMPAMIKELEPDERKELKIASFLFVFCSLGLILILWRDMGANLFYTLFFYLMALVITIGLVRAVTEGGVLSFQCQGGPFHFIRSFFGLDKSWTSTSLFAPLMVYYAMIFLDIKTFIAPAFANSLKLRADFKMNRGRFHLAVILAVVLAAVTGIVTAIMMCYSGGADIMQSWFYTSLPKNAMFEVVRSMTKDAPEVSPALSLWIGGGAVAMAALLYFRQFIFWLPHPLGMVMFINPIMRSFWFSILLGWMANSMVTKFGNKETFHRIKGFFIGLIVGELILIVISMILSVILETNVTVTLNR